MTRSKFSMIITGDNRENTCCLTREITQYIFEISTETALTGLFHPPFAFAADPL
jgi:hypothetical protein